ncbi:MAG: FAD:protein FMN transferase [Oscillospiraceae bacterium]|nr:FAD:protein FMN transferase [Oscillospiraceae bacterium]
MLKKYFLYFVLFAAVVFSAPVLTACTVLNNNPEQINENENIYKNENVSFLMDTTVTMTVYSGEDETGKQVLERVTAKLTELQNKASMYLPDSDITKLNESVGGQLHPVQVEIHELTFDLLSRSKEYSEASGGLFDVTVGVLTDLWKITSGDAKIPGDGEIDRALTQVGIENLLLDKKRKTAALNGTFTKIDLGGIAKGYGSDLAMEIFRESNIFGAVLSIGGNVTVFGDKGGGEKFKIGVRNPFGGQNEIIGTLTKTGCITSTSGTYERNAVIDGKIYSHIFDPRTGRPAQSDIESVTVVSESGTYGDYLSTALYVGGMSKVQEHLEFIAAGQGTDTNDGLICIDKQKNVWISDNLKQDFELTDAAFTPGLPGSNEQVT